ncbi:MAG TPA: right-handed parallel beta-helix repeat-containing protein, partial [Thermoleophilaceae bacterium]|nr:right-handed parallel beta-helix repeat-containing protein [Thermoleophilaceae bacterium]
VESNTFVQNAMPIHIYGSHRNVIRNNDVSGIILDPTLDSDAGIVVEAGSRDNILEDNNVSDTGDAGVKIHEGSHGTQVIGGVYVRNGDAGVIAELSDRIVIDDIVSHQQSDGGVVIGDSSDSIVKNSDLRYNPSGIQASNTNRLIVDGNDASESLQAGIEVGNGLSMRITNNVANLSGGSGISVEGGTFDSNGVAHAGARIAGNTTNENAEDGISVAENAKHTIADNVANSNAGYGIRAGGEPAPGEPVDPNANIDGGGNKASGNHAELGVAPGAAGLVQCLGVVCQDDDNAEISEVDLTPPNTIIDDGPVGPTPSPTASTGSETAVFEFHGVDNATATSAMVFECRVDAPPDPPLPPEDPDLEPPDPLEQPELPEPPEGANWGECVSPHTLLSLEPGEHVLEVRAHDWAGNFDLTPAVYKWTIHAGVDEEGRVEVPPVAPETRITAAPGELITDEAGTRYDTTNHSATFKFTGSDNLTSGYNLAYECRLYYDEFNDELTPADIPDGSDPAKPEPQWESCTSPKLYSDLEYGGHIFEARAVDLAGNKDVTPAWHSWWIHPPPPDVTPPDTEITSGPDPVTVQTTATFEFTGSDNQTPVEEVKFQCRLDGAMSAAGEPEWTECSSPHAVTVSSSATATEHVLQVRAVDLAGNVDGVNGTNADDLTDGTPAAYVWTVGAAPVTK